MPIRLSIVIPFYNVEKYIAECLDSVYNQDIPEDEYEVICVNDASPDGSRDIVLEYQKKHPNLVLVEHEVNKKLGAARNTGRRIARGKYLWNVDSDDMIAPNCLGEILERCEKNDLDVLMFSFDTLVGQETMVRPRPWVEANPCTGFQFWEQQVIPHQAEVSQVWTQVYKKAYLDEKGVFSPEINMSEDVPYAYSSILQSGRIIAVPSVYYYSRQHLESLTKEILHSPTTHKLYEGSLVAGRYLYSVFSLIPGKEGQIRSSVRNAVIYMIVSAWDIYHRQSPSFKKEFGRICRRNSLQNLYVFHILGKNKIIQYIKILLGQ